MPWLVVWGLRFLLFYEVRQIGKEPCCGSVPFAGVAEQLGESQVEVARPRF
jgi:hypothetical protein